MKKELVLRDSVYNEYAEPFEMVLEQILKMYIKDNKNIFKILECREYE